MKNGKRVIWFNHWFSQAYNFIELLKRDERNYMIASAKVSEFVFGAHADEVYTEPRGVDGREYTEWCIEFCRKHSVDVFFAKRWFGEVIKHAEDFRSVGTEIAAEKSPELIKMLNSKKISCDYMRDHSLCPVPHTELITDAEKFPEAYDIIRSVYGENSYVCAKADTDEGGVTYRRIYDENNGKQFAEDISYRAFYEDLLSRQRARGRIAPMVVMPYLNEPEISVDCMNINGSLIAVPRYKTGTHITLLDFNEDIINTAEKISSDLNIEYPYNLQMRKLCGEYVFMEINTRMAGGCYKADAVGCNFPQLAVSYRFGDLIDTGAIKKGFCNKKIGDVSAFVEL